MIDWITARVPVRAAAFLKAGEVSSVDADGVVEWVAPKRVRARGSHNATVMVRQVGGGLEFAGSPAKFLQGHNVFGSDDLRGLGVEMITFACKALDVELADDERRMILTGTYQLLRVDVNYSYGTGSRTTALEWVGQAAAVGSVRGRGAGRMFGSTAIWGPSSRHWTLKAYCKGAEIAAKGHNLPPSLPLAGEVAAWADDKVRIELQIMARGLRKLGLDRASSWLPHTPLDLHSTYLAKLQLGARLTLTPEGIQDIPSYLRQTYHLWSLGADVRKDMLDAKYFRHKKELLALGVNIAVPFRDGHAEHIPLAEYLKSPCTVPEWALGTGLYYEPVKAADGAIRIRMGITVRLGSGVTSTRHKMGPGRLRSPRDAKSTEADEAIQQDYLKRLLGVASKDSTSAAVP